MRMLRVLAGGVLGLVIGTVLGFIATAWQVSREYPGQTVGIDPTGLWHTPIFWAVLLPSVVGFGYLFSRIGRQRQRASHV